MMAVQISRTLEFATFQMASEAFLVEATDVGQPTTAFLQRRLERGNTHASVFTPTQATEFVGDYQVLAQNRSEAALTAFDAFSAREAT